MVRFIKYVLKEFTGPFFMGLIGFIIFVSVELLYQLSDQIVRYRVGIDKLLVLIYYNLPYFTVLGIPVGILFAIFWIISRFSNDNEIIALITLGIPSKMLVIPLILISIFLSFVTFALNDTIVPSFNLKAKRYMIKVIKKKPEGTIQENVVVEVEENKYFYVRKIDRKTGVLYDAIIYEVKPSKVTVYHARRVVKIKNKWYMEDGRIFRLNKEGLLKLDISFDRLELDIKQDIEEFINLAKGPYEMTTKELREKIKTFSKLGIDVANLIVIYQEKFANSVAPLVIALMGISLSLLINLRSKSWGVISTFILVVLYQGSGAWLSALGKQRIINPETAPWLPNIFFGITGAIIFLLLDTKVAYKILEPLKRIFGIILIATILSLPGHLEAGTVKISSENITVQGTKVTIDGSTTIWYEDSVIFATHGYAILNEKHRILKAVLDRDVVYKHKDHTIEASYLVVDFQEDLLKLEKIYSIENYTTKKKKKVKIRVWGEYSYKNTKEKIIKVYNAKFTTCKIKHPTYYFRAIEATIYPDNYIIAKNVFLEFFGIPVIFLPFLFQSLQEENPLFAISFIYSKDSISIRIEINKRFGDILFSYNQTYLKSFSEDKKDKNKISLSFTIPFHDIFDINIKGLFDNSVNKLYSFNINKKFDLFTYEFTIQKSFTDGDVFSRFSVKDFKFAFFKLNNTSLLSWKDSELNKVIFYNISAPSIKKKFGKSYIQLSSLKIYSESDGKPLDEAWKDRKNLYNFKVSYKFLSKNNSLNGEFLYEYRDKKDQILVEKSFYKVLWEMKNPFSFDLLFIKFNTSLNPLISFAYRKDYPNIYKDYFMYGYESNFNISLLFLKFGIEKYERKFVLINEGNLISSPSTNVHTYSDFIQLNVKKDFDSLTFLFSWKFLRKFDLISSPDFSKPKSVKLSTDNNLSLFFIKTNLKTDTLFSPEKSFDPLLTQVRGFVSMFFWKHSYSFDFDHKKDKHVEIIKNEDLFTIDKNKIKIKYDYKIEEDELKEKIPFVFISYLFYDLLGGKYSGNIKFYDNYEKFHFDLNYNLKDPKIKISTSFDLYNPENDQEKKQFTNKTSIKYYKNIDYIKISFTYNLIENTLKFSEFDIQKQLVCWAVQIKGKLKLLPEFEFKEFMIKFFIADIPEKSISYQEEEGFSVELF